MSKVDTNVDVTSLDELKEKENFGSTYSDDQSVDDATDFSSVDELVEFALDKESTPVSEGNNPLMDADKATITTTTSPNEWQQNIVYANEYTGDQAIDITTDISGVDELVEFAMEKEGLHVDKGSNPLMDADKATIDNASSPGEWQESVVFANDYTGDQSIDTTTELSGVDELVAFATKKK